MLKLRLSGKLKRVCAPKLFGHEKVNLTSSPRASSISLFSLSPGPMCLSAKSSCLGNILSICLEETAADVLRPRAAVVMDAPRFRILHWSFQTTRLLSLRCLHSALGFTDLAKKIPQDLAQLCISKSLCKTSLQKKQNKLLTPCPPLTLQSFPHWDWYDSCRRLCQLLQNCRVYTTAQLHKGGPIRPETLRDAVRSPVKQLLNFLTCPPVLGLGWILWKDWDLADSSRT